MAARINNTIYLKRKFIYVEKKLHKKLIINIKIININIININKDSKYKYNKNNDSIIIFYLFHEWKELCI